MKSKYKEKSVKRSGGVVLKKLKKPTTHRWTTGWEMCSIFLVRVTIERNLKFEQNREVIYKERGRDINKDKDLLLKINKAFDIGSKDVFKITDFNKIKFLGYGAED